jgi:hypothetical protein
MFGDVRAPGPQQFSPQIFPVIGFRLGRHVLSSLSDRALVWLISPKKASCQTI